MTRTFCDRCGAEIKEKEYSYFAHRLIYAEQRLIPPRFREDWKSDKDKHICPQCENEYIEWFNNPPTRKE